MTSLCVRAAAILWLSIPAGCVRAQEFSIDWFTVAGGGGTSSSGGSFDLGGTIGQIDAGALVDGSIALTGGFWVWPSEQFSMVSGFEADVAPRPAGDGMVSVADWVQVGRFAAGLDSAAAGSEFQRADCAPLASSGDGLITVADWVQAGRFAAGLDARVDAGGPTSAGP